MSTKLEHIPLDKIEQNKEVLRKVDRQKVDYLELVESVRDKGVMTPISVREFKDPANGEIKYGLIDGLQRYTASLDAGRDTIPAQVLPIVEADVLEMQIIGNSHVIPTKRGEYAKALLQIMNGKPYMTESDLAAKLKKSTKWLRDILSLNDLNVEILKLVDDGKIPVQNAYSLAKVPEENQKDFLQGAMTLSTQEFGAGIEDFVKKQREDKKQGKGPKATEYQPNGFLRKVSEFKAAADSKKEVARILKGITGKEPSKEETEAAHCFAKWTLHLDEPTLKTRKDEWENKKKLAEEERNKKKAEADAAKEKEAAKAKVEMEEKLKKLREGVTV